MLFSAFFAIVTPSTMLKGIQTAVAVILLICLAGVQTVHAQIPSKQLTSFSVLDTSCKASPEEFLYALRFGQKLGDSTSYKDLGSDVTAVFASSKGENSHFQTEITARVDDGTVVVETSEPIVVAVLTPTVTPYTTTMPSVSVAPVSKQAEAINAGLDPEVLFSMANAYRAKLGLPAFEKDSKVCEIAAGRGPELNGEVASGTMHAGLYNDNHPFWVTENMIYMRTNEEAFAWWLNSPVHRGQLQGNFKYACAACVGNACTMVFTNYVSK